MTDRLQDLRGYPKLATLRKLRVDVQSQAGIQKAVALEHLDITLGDTWLHELTRLNQLTRLTLRGAFDGLDLSGLRNLRELVVVSPLNANWVKSRSIERIDFTTTPITLLGLQTPKLTHLRIRDTPLTELRGLWEEKHLRQIELSADRIQTIEVDTDAFLRKLGKQLTIVDGKRRQGYAAFAATKQIVPS